MKKLVLTLVFVSSLSIAAFAYWVPAAGSPSTQQVGDLKVTLVPYTKELDQANFRFGPTYTNPDVFVNHAFMLTIENTGSSALPINTTDPAMILPNHEQIGAKSAARSYLLMPSAFTKGTLVFEPDTFRQKYDGGVSIWLPCLTPGQTVHFEFDWVKK